MTSVVVIVTLARSPETVQIGFQVSLVASQGTSAYLINVYELIKFAKPTLTHWLFINVLTMGDATLSPHSHVEGQKCQLLLFSKNLLAGHQCLIKI